MNTARLGLLCIAFLPFPRAQEARQPFQVRLQLSVEPGRVLVCDLLPMMLVFTNTGTRDVPFSRCLLEGPDGGALLTVVVEGSGDRSARTEFVPEPSPSSRCGPGWPVLLARGQQETTKFAVGGKCEDELVVAGRTRQFFVPALPHAGRYEVRICYRYEGTTCFSNPVEVVACEPTGNGRLALEFLRTMGGEALWMYEGQLMPHALRKNEEARLVHLAEDFGINAYSDYARFALASNQAGWSLCEEEGFRARVARARTLLEGIGAPEFKLTAEAERLSTWLAYRDGWGSS